MKLVRNVDEAGCVMPREFMTARIKKRLDNSTVKLWKTISKEREIDVPTSFVVLPFELKWNHEMERLIAPTEDHIELSEQIGKCLLRMNKTTARLSFWLAMRQQMVKKEFKGKLKKWILRARREDTKLVATEIVKEIKCGMSYVSICREVLEKDVAYSNAKEYIDDPLRAATDELEHCTKTLTKCFSSDNYFFYLLDEHRWIPVSSCAHCIGSNYPLSIRSNESMLRTLFLPFMNVALLAVTAMDGLAGLANMLGLPPSRGIPSCWMNAKLGLIQHGSRLSDLQLFASLQRTMREDKKACSEDATNEAWCYAGSGSGLQQEDPSEVTLLKEFYRLNDQASTFSDLRTLSDDKGSKLWLSASELQKVVSEAEQVFLTHHNRKLNREWTTIDMGEEEMEMMNTTPIELKGKRNRSDSIRSLHTTETEWSHSTRSTLSSSFKFKASEKTRKIMRNGKKLITHFGACVKRG